MLLVGRRLFWLLVATIGFLAGFQLTPHLLAHPPMWLALTVSLALGLLGALLALLLQKVAIAIAGFVIGGHIATSLTTAFVNSHADYSVVTFIIGGVVGALLLLLLFDWALIIFSSIAGAELIVPTLHLPSTGTTILLIALTVLGIAVQSAMLRRRL